jgi:hypothetical protein
MTKRLDGVPGALERAEEGARQPVDAPGTGPLRTGARAPIQEWLRGQPAWRLVLAPGLLAVLTRLTLGAPSVNRATIVALVVENVLLVTVLVIRDTPDGWKIWGISILTSTALQEVSWSFGIEAAVFVTATTVLVWLIVDRRADGGDRRADGG